MYAVTESLLEPPVILDAPMTGSADELSMPASRVVMLTLAMLALFSLVV